MMTLLVTHSVAVGVGCLIAGALSRYSILKRERARRELGFALRTIDHEARVKFRSPARQGGGL